MHARFFAALVVSVALTAPAHAAKCGGDFDRFVSEFRREAAAKGIPARVLAEAFDDIEYDPKVMAFDRRQRNTFKRTWQDYARTRVTPARVKRARNLLKRHQKLFDRVEARFGVPRELVMAIWTMETDNGGDTGKMPVVKTLTTLAHDCRRSDLFQGELLAALQIIARGDLSKRDLLGAYAGEIGQTQFLPSSYIKYGVDFDGDGHVNLRRSVPDVLASTANLLAVNGWQKGQPFGEGTQNFMVLREWNRSEVYRKTLHYFAEQLRSSGE